MQKNTLVLVCAVCFFLFLGTIFFVKASLVTYWYHLDPWVIQPLGQLLESNLSWQQHVMFPGLGLRLFYVTTVIYALLTGLTYGAVTKWGFILVSGIFVYCLAVLLRSRFSSLKNKAVLIIVFLLLMVQNDFFLRRLSMTVRENYALIAFVTYFLLYVKGRFTHTFLMGILSGVIYGSNPITSFMLLAYNGIYGLYRMIKKDAGRFWQRAKQFFRGILCGLYFFIEFIKSLFRQYHHVETEVVLKNPFPYDFYYITLKHINIVLVILFVIALIYVGRALVKKKHLDAGTLYKGELIMLGIMGGVYLIAFFPQVGLYQDRLVMYISIFSFLLMIPFFAHYKNNLLLFFLSVYALIGIGMRSGYEYYSPFDNTQLALPAYDLLTNYTGKVIVFKFDEYVLRHTNPFLSIDYGLVEEFSSIQNKEALKEFLASHDFVLFLTKATMWQEDTYYNLPAIKILTATGKITTLEDGNFLYIHTRDMGIE